MRQLATGQEVTGANLSLLLKLPQVANLVSSPNALNSRAVSSSPGYLRSEEPSWPQQQRSFSFPAFSDPLIEYQYSAISIFVNIVEWERVARLATSDLFVGQPATAVWLQPL